MYAIVRCGGRQEKVALDDVLTVDKLADEEAGSSVSFPALLVVDSAELGMISFDQHLAQRYSEQYISKHVALELAHDQGEFKRLARIAP